VNLKWLELAEFRSYETLQLNPETGVNIYVGENAAGKTNILEAVAYLALMRSFRAIPDSGLVRQLPGHPPALAAVLRGEIASGDRNSLIELELPSEGRRRIQVNRQRLARTADILGYARVVVFLPDDLDIIKRSPGLRRQFLDQVAVQLRPAAYVDQQEYERVVKQRNSLLRLNGRHTDAAVLSAWNEKMSQAGARVMARRAASAAAIGEYVQGAYEELAGEPIDIDLGYTSGWEATLDPGTGVAELEARLWSALERADVTDRERRVTTVGPHRDEPVFTLGGRPSRTQASQGEQRSLVLALRLAAHRAITASTQEPPILVLDDVFSELDITRARALANALPQAQTFISTARFEEVPVEGKRWLVEKGTVT
jgi:DNA replication and repair protein RecF